MAGKPCRRLGDPFPQMPGTPLERTVQGLPAHKPGQGARCWGWPEIKPRRRIPSGRGRWTAAPRCPEGLEGLDGRQNILLPTGPGTRLPQTAAWSPGRADMASTCLQASFFPPRVPEGREHYSASWPDCWGTKAAQSLTAQTPDVTHKHRAGELAQSCFPLSPAQKAATTPWPPSLHPARLTKGSSVSQIT